MKKVFLGGTCNESQWRNKLIELLEIDYFNPVVNNWDSKAQKEELKQRKESDYCLYVITPKMTGVYSIAEVIDDSNKQPDKTIFCVLEEDDNILFNEQELRSLWAVGDMVKKNGAKYFESLYEIARYLNQQ